MSERMRFRVGRSNAFAATEMLKLVAVNLRVVICLSPALVACEYTAPRRTVDSKPGKDFRRDVTEMSHESEGLASGAHQDGACD